MNGIYRVPIDVSAIGDTELVAAVASRRLSVAGMFVVSEDVVNVTLKAGGVAVTGPLPLAANSGFVLPVSTGLGAGWAVAGDGENLAIHLDAAVQVAGSLVYRIE
jgi:hypothetical protein